MNKFSNKKSNQNFRTSVIIYDCFYFAMAGRDDYSHRKIKYSTSTFIHLYINRGKFTLDSYLRASEDPGFKDLTITKSLEVFLKTSSYPGNLSTSQR